MTDGPAGLDPFVGALDYPMYVVTAAGAGAEWDGCLVGFATQCSIDPARWVRAWTMSVTTEPSSSATVAGGRPGSSIRSAATAVCR